MVLSDPRRGRDEQQIREVWAWNFDAEIGELLATTAPLKNNVILALDTEFPGFLREEPHTAGKARQYQALRDNVDNLRPIQIGIAVANEDGTLLGTWSFNLRFDVAMDLHTEESINFLRAAGLDFERHASQGIEPAVIGRRLAASPLVGRSSRPEWVTFQGLYDFGYLLKLLTSWPLPSDVSAFESALTAFCPRRRELRDTLPRGSLDSLIHDRGVERVGAPHTAGSDALATLELFLQLEKIDASSNKSDVLIPGAVQMQSAAYTIWASEPDETVDAGWVVATDVVEEEDAWQSPYTATSDYWNSSGSAAGVENVWGVQDMGYSSDPYYGLAQQQAEVLGKFADDGSCQLGHASDLRAHLQAEFTRKILQPVQATQPLLQTSPPVNLTSMLSISGCYDGWDWSGAAAAGNTDMAIGEWDTSYATNMSYMFAGAQSFNQAVPAG